MTRAAGVAIAAEKALTLGKRRLDAFELHQTFAIGVLAIDQYERRFANCSWDMAKTRDFAQRF